MTAAGANGTTLTGFAAAASSGAPIGDMIRIMGDTMFHGSGLILVLIFAATVVLALIGTTLACLNTGVRVTYAMAKDKEMPSVLGFLHGKFATPHWGVWILVLVSAIFGAYGVLSVDNLTQITLASNTGTFLVYGLTNLIALVAFTGRPGAKFLQHKLAPVMGFLANLMMLFAILYLSVKGGGSTSKDAMIALVMVAAWLVAGVVWFVTNSRRQGHVILTKQVPQGIPEKI
jgi:amino acid transporter